MFHVGKGTSELTKYRFKTRYPIQQQTQLEKLRLTNLSWVKSVLDGNIGPIKNGLGSGVKIGKFRRTPKL